MKKFLLILISLSCLTMLFGCDIPFLNDKDSDNDNDSTTPEYYTVTFDSAGGTSVKPVTVKPGETCDKPYAPLRFGAEFAGWYFDDILWNFKTNKIDSDITLTAKWNFIEYIIDYDLSGGRFSSSLPNSYTVETETIVLTDATKDGCKFAGWYLNGKLVTEIPKGSSGNLHLVADFYGPDATVPGSETATARTWDNNNNITVKLTADTTDPMTVRIDFNKQWQTVKVQQGNKIDYVDTYTEGDKLMLDITMTPGEEDAVITPVILIGDTVLESKYGKVLADGTKIDKNYYPGFVRKAITFSIDDGNYTMDTKFLNIVRPAGIIGTFNLKDTSAASAAQLLALYKGYEIANHHFLHCLPERDNTPISSYNVKNEVFNSSKADKSFVYKAAKPEGLYYIDYTYYATGAPATNPSSSSYWHPVASYETYTKYIDKTTEDLESVFGEGSVIGFAYPHGKYSEAVKSYLESNGYLYARATTASSPKPTDFALPADRFAWVYNADSSNLNEAMAKYDALADDGKLKFFSFGVHSVDFDGKWSVLETFAETYGNRPEDFWYASNRDIFEYEDAVNALEITSDEVINPSDIAVFVTINNVKTIIPANSTYKLK